MLQVANGDEMMLAGDAHEELPQSVFVGARRGRWLPLQSFDRGPPDAGGTFETLTHCTQ